MVYGLTLLLVTLVWIWENLIYHVPLPKNEAQEKLCDSDNMAGLFEEIDSLLKMQNPMAVVRHYSFIDFAKVIY